MAGKNNSVNQLQEYGLERFVEAQQHIYPRVITELKNGDKQSHWMWFVFPQMDGLGNSPTAKRYAIKSIDEAKAYLEHPVLGPRLQECSAILLDITGKTAEQIFGFPDYVKLQSCMTLFSIAMPDKPVFMQVLAKYYGSQKDRKTIAILNDPGRQN